MKKKQAIAIIHNKGDSPWLQPLLSSIDTEYPLLITNHDGWCMNAVQQTFERTEFDEIVFLNESMEVKNNDIWKLIFEKHGGKSVMLSDRYLMFLGKFLRSRIPEFPDVQTKRDDVLKGEGIWCRQYMQTDPYYEAIQPLKDNHQVFEQKNGRRNMVLENDYFIKWKGHWDLSNVT